MGILDNGGGANCFTAAVRWCDVCKAVAAVLYCRDDAAFLCGPCDGKFHGTARHERVWMCEVCEQAPASVTCKADAAALCVTCDRDIHSANPLARRHDRVPVVPFYETASAAAVKSTLGTELLGVSPFVPSVDFDKVENDVVSTDLKAIELLLTDSDQVLDFGFTEPTDLRLQRQLNGFGTDGVVPVKHFAPAAVPSSENCCVVDFVQPNPSFNYNSTFASNSLSQSVSSSSLDVVVVPDGSTLSEISYPFTMQMNGGVDVSVTSNNGERARQLTGSEREARVMRYREKKKNRKFQKTVRYASRKAYAEIRPRIKGRFAKRTDIVMDIDRWFGNSGLIEDAEYGVVPEF